MPRKQNGFGSAKSFSVGSINNKIDRGKGIQGTGQYPSNRQFGSTVTRSVVQQWNLDSTWMMWRKGYEYARQNVWVDLNVLFFAFLFSGTTSRLRANFRCKRFPSLTNDTATRYVVKREIPGSVTDPRYGTITSILNDPFTYTKNFQNEELWIQVAADADPVKGDVLKRLVHERITNKRHGVDYSTTKTFEATVKTLLKSDSKPMVYTATSKDRQMILTVKIPRDEILSTPYVQENGLFSLEGQVIRVTNMPIGMAKEGLTFIDDTDTVKVDMNMTRSGEDYWIANVSDQTPFEVFVDTSPLIIASGSTATLEMDNEFTIFKSEYQKYFDNYITGETIDNETSQMSFVIPPLYISTVADDGTNIIINTIPIEPQLFLYAEDPNPYLVLSDFSFTSWQRQENGDVYNDTSIFPWQDQTFLVGDGIYVADAYACNCQSFSHSTVTSPEALYRRYTGAALTKNRQLKYPLPSALSNKDIEGLGQSESGVIVNWATRRNNEEHKLCKHVIAGIFAEQEVDLVVDGSGGALPGTGGVPVGDNKGYKVLEPNTFPGYQERLEVEQKITENTKNVDFSESGPRAEISPIDFSFATLQLLNLMDTEVGSILGGNVALIPVTTPRTIEEGIFVD